MEYAEQEPFGEERADLRAGIITANIMNTLILINSDSRRGRPKLFSAADFMPRFDKEPEKQKLMDQSDWEDFKAMMIASAQ